MCAYELAVCKQGEGVAFRIGVCKWNGAVFGYQFIYGQLIFGLASGNLAECSGLSVHCGEVIADYCAFACDGGGHEFTVASSAHGYGIASCVALHKRNVAHIGSDDATAVYGKVNVYTVIGIVELEEGDGGIACKYVCVGARLPQTDRRSTTISSF